MSDSQGMYEHFAKVASVYREVRTTDEEPILYIRDCLAGRSRITAADVGCGAGRYDLLLFRYLPDLSLTCVDVNPAMLAELSRYLEDHGIEDFRTVCAGVEEMRLDSGIYDCVTTFNAAHHFDFPVFLEKAGRAIRDDGRIFVYTRTPEQNARSVWGRYFPEFAERETRLYPLERMTRWVEEADGLRLVAHETFRYARQSDLDRLLAQVRNKHYSTFSLYSEQELETACNTFADNIRRQTGGADTVEWQDENVMLVIGRAGA